MKRLVDNLEKKYEFKGSDKPLGEGFEARVYSLNEDLAVKIPISYSGEDITFEDNETSNLLNEFINHNGFYTFFKGDEKVNIVKPHGIYALKNLENGQHYPGFVMDKLNGTRLTDIPNVKEKDLFVDALEQWMKIHELGVKPEELNFENTIWVPNEGKNYLIDLSGWKFMKGKQFKKFADFFDHYKNYLKKE